ncbi:cupin domain-containing protein [Paraflavitalea pollutisoli]|uniref:cupin domain-containing protein n=1 Tax=Paraflavitalea pollutisoli TaxID=3034143 RepID=UPI0023ECC15F|nr:cupin domain-containing protein [Paraflavitalea sp. H1-2-19X]
MEKRVFENPDIKDRVHFLQTSAETNGAYTLVEVELEPGGGNSLHYHTHFDEEFTAIDGVLSIGLKKRQLQLKPGEKAIARINQLHRFYNASPHPIRFHVRLTPGSTEFEKSIAIAYGLASDGLTSKSGIPKKLDHLAVILDLSNTRLTGFFAWILPWLLRRAKRARRKGILQELENRYWQQPVAPHPIVMQAVNT